MAKKKENSGKRSVKKIFKVTKIKRLPYENMEVFKDYYITKYEVLAPKKGNYYEREFIISSISGKEYKVTVSRLVNCTCPICFYKVKRCKHIEFVMQEILHEKYPRIYYDEKALDSLFQYLPGHIKNKENKCIDNKENGK